MKNQTMLIELETPNFLESNFQKFIKENSIKVERKKNALCSLSNCPVYYYSQNIEVLQNLLVEFWAMEKQEAKEFLYSN